MQIKTISSISISDSWEGVQLHEIALRQGDLDGACGPYSLMMALLLSDGLSRTQAQKLWNGDADGRSKFGKWTAQADALITKGTDDADLKDLFKAIQSFVDTAKIHSLNIVNVPVLDKTGGITSKSALSAIRDHIDNANKPVILILKWSKSTSHWVVAIGYQVRVKNGKEELAHILTLDPGSSIGKTSAWNGVLGQGAVGDRKLRYMTEDSEPCICSISKAIGLTNNTTRRASKKS